MEVHDVASLMKAAGGFGRFQLFAVIVLSISYAYVGFMLNNVYLLELVPKVRCREDFGPWLPDDDCDFDEICVDGDIGPSWTIEVVPEYDSL